MKLGIAKWILMVAIAAVIAGFGPQLAKAQEGGDACSAALPLGVLEGPAACGVIITVTAVDANGNATAATISTPGNGNPYDDSDDTLVGVVNSSDGNLNSIGLTSSNDIFGFDGDGPCSYSTADCFGPSGYEGPDNTFIVGQNYTSGTVNFTAPILSGGSTWFALEGDPTSISTVTVAFMLNVALLDSGTGTVTDNMGQINCSEANGTVTGTCSASYNAGTPVTLTATPNSPTPSTPLSTFAGWGGACASFGTATTCNLTVNSGQNVSASFDLPGQTQSGDINPGNSDCPPESPDCGGPITTFPFNGGFKEGSPSSGFDVTGQQTNTTQTLDMSVTAIPISQAACNALVRLNPSFSTAKCFVIQNGGGPGIDSSVLFEVTCPPNGSCGSTPNPFDAILGSDFSFTCTENLPLLCGPPPLPFSFGPPNLTSFNGLPSVGFLKGAGPNENHPCSTDPNNPLAPLFQSNQIVSFTVGDTSSKPIKGGSGGSTSCWEPTYLTPGETPTVVITKPAAGGTYQQNESDSTTLANYTCTAVNAGGSSATGPYLLVASCTATDTPGGSVPNGAQFDTSTTGPHTFTANVEDSATNTSSSTVTYYVMGAPATKSANYTTFIEGTKGSFTITTSGYPYSSITYSPAGSLPAGVTLVDNHNGTATLSGTPPVSGVFSFWLKLSNGVGTPTLQSFTLTVTAPVSVTPTSLAFGSVTVGQSSKKTVTVQNTSGKTLSIGPTTITFISGTKNQFSVSQACPATLAAGGSCTIGVSFAPTAKTTDAATLSIGTSALANPLNVSLTGTGK